jgi:hypothetical protein
MRTTVDIPDPIYRHLKAKAAREGRSVRELILRGTERELRAPVATGLKRVRLPIIRSKRPGSLQLDNAKIYEIIPFP